MFSLPINTERNIHYYKKEICDSLKWEENDKKYIKKLYSNINDIYIVNEISKEEISAIDCTINIQNISFILLELKNENIDFKLLEKLFKDLKKGIIFILNYDNKYKLAFYYDKVLISDFIDKSYKIVLRGNNFDVVYENLIKDICSIKTLNDNTLKEQLEENDKVELLKKEIKILENKCKNEKQFNKKVELNKRINILIKAINDINTMEV